MHAIPIGTLVEIDLDYDDHHGVRGFVVEHTQDFDGTPLYSISIQTVEEANLLKQINEWLYRFSLLGGWNDDCLKVITKGDTE